MTSHIRTNQHAFRTTIIGALAVLIITPSSSAAFNPNEGIEKSPAVLPTPSRLPSTAPLVESSSRFSFTDLPDARRIPSGNPAPTDAATAAIAAPPGAFVQPIPLANQPMAVSQPAAISAPAGAFLQPIPPTVELAPVYSTPQFPPVDAAVAAQAAHELGVSSPSAHVGTAQSQTTVGTQPVQSFIAPAPLLAESATSRQRPNENPPVAFSKPIATASTETLSNASKDILSKFPSKLDSTVPAAKGKGQKLAINRISPDIQAIANPKQKIESFDAVGLSIKVQRPGLDTNFELNRAYTALNSGDTTLAAQTYKNILSTEPRNEDALFGLAATYHRIGDLERARPYYAQLLKVNPNHREGLNNFLSLVSSEAPQEALAELERLEQRNPDFSPIPAQQASLLSKNGFPEQAREKMLRAIELAPDNLTYTYNLAVMLDRQGKYLDASALYRLLIDAALKGQKIPSSLDIIQKRLNFIATNSAANASAGG